MTNPTSGENEPRDAAYWAKLITTLEVTGVPTGALNLNVAGRQVVGPLQGFGQLWQKTYRVRLPSVTMTPAEVMQIWKENFPTFLPRGMRFYPVMQSVEPGQIMLINTDASLMGIPVSTGVMILYADEETLTVMTPQGHPESGWNTFSTYDDDGCVVCQIQTLARANDPIYELGFRLIGTGKQDNIWIQTLETVAIYFHVNGQVTVSKTCLDPQVQWKEAKNVWQNAGIWTILYTLAAPIRWLLRPLKRRRS